MSGSARRFVLRAAAAAAAAGSGAAGAIGVLVAVQARLAAGRPADKVVGYTVDGLIDGDGAPRRVVWLGDSLAAGIGAVSRELTLPHLVATHSPEPTRVHVFATPGATAADVVRDQLPALGQLRQGLAGIGDSITAVGVSVGANDIAAMTSRRHLRRRLDAIVASAEGTPMVFLSIPQIGDAIRLPHPLRAIARARGAWLDRELRAVARRHSGVAYASVRERPPWIRRQHRAHFLSADRFHPSGAGYAVWADGIAQAFDRLLAVPTGSVEPSLA